MITEYTPPTKESFRQAIIEWSEVVELFHSFRFNDTKCKDELRKKLNLEKGRHSRLSVLFRMVSIGMGNCSHAFVDSLCKELSLDPQIFADALWFNIFFQGGL